jgi:hypothetical protein
VQAPDTAPERELNVKYSKVAAIAAGTLMAVGVAAPAFADSDASAITAHSPGVLSGNSVQVPIHIPVNLCGNTVNVIGLLNPAFGNTCVNK